MINSARVNTHTSGIGMTSSVRCAVTALSKKQLVPLKNNQLRVDAREDDDIEAGVSICCGVVELPHLNNKNSNTT